MSEWKECLLSDVADLCLGKMLDAKKNKGVLHPYLNNVAVRWGAFDLDGLPQMRFEDSEFERYTVRRNDVVACEGGEPGRCAIWKSDEPVYIQKALHRIRAKAGVCAEFLYYQFSHLVKTGQTRGLESGTTIRHLPGQALAKVELRLPPLPTQRAIVAYLDEKCGGREVEGDWSQAAFFLAMGVEVKGLKADSHQGDKAVVELLAAIDGALSRGGDIPVAAILDVAQTPDLYPCLAAYAAARGREVIFTGTERLRLKESDRIASTAALIESVKSGKPVNTFGDHRIAMSAAVMACYSKIPVTVEGAECVAKSYPGFWGDFERLEFRRD